MFWQVLFWALLVPTLLVLGIVYGTTKQLYKLFQILATYTYVVTIAYVIDVFSLGRDWILGLLVFSAVLMLVLGYYLTKKARTKGKVRGKKQLPTKKALYALLSTLALMLVLIIIANNGYAVGKNVNLVDEISRTTLFTNETGYDVRAPIGTVSYENNHFLPAVIPERSYTACLHDRTNDEYAYEAIGLLVDGAEYYLNDAAAYDEVMPGEERTFKLSLQPRYYPKGAPRPIVEEDGVFTASDYDRYDKVLVVASDGREECNDLSEKVTFTHEIALVE